MIPAEKTERVRTGRKEASMGLFSDLFDDAPKGDYDYKRLRRDLENEYAAQSAGFSGGFGFCQMLDVSNASNEKLLKMAKKEGFNLNKYKKR